MTDHAPTLEDVLGEILDAQAADIRVALPGKVVRYDTAKQIADVEIQLKDAYVDDTGAVVTRAFPIVRAPVQFMRGGGFFVIVPIAVGDTGLLLFTDLPIDRWRASGQPSHPGDIRRHSLTSAVFFPGLVPAAAALSEASANADLVLGKVSSLNARITAAGLFQVGTGTFTAAAAEKIATELARINADLSALKTAIATGFTAGGGAGPAYAGGATQASAFNGASSAIPSAPGDVASAKVKIE